MAEKLGSSSQEEIKYQTSEEKALEDKTKEVAKKEKEFLHKLSLNKNPTVQQFIKTWLSINTELNKQRVRHSFTDGKSPLRGQLDDGFGSVRLFLQEFAKDPSTGKIGRWTNKGPLLKRSFERGARPDLQFRTHMYKTSYLADDSGIHGMKITYSKFDSKENKSPYSDEELSRRIEAGLDVGHDHSAKKSGIIIMIDGKGHFQFYENPEDTKFKPDNTLIEEDVSKMKKLTLKPEDQDAIIKELTINFQKRLKINKEFDQQQDNIKRAEEAQKLQKAKEEKITKSKQAAQSVKKVL